MALDPILTGAVVGGPICDILVSVCGNTLFFVVLPIATGCVCTMIRHDPVRCEVTTFTPPYPYSPLLGRYMNGTAAVYFIHARSYWTFDFIAMTQESAPRHPVIRGRVDSGCSDE